MTSDLFNTEHERRGTSSLKWDKYKDQDILPMWVADMDFQSPPEVIEAMQARVAHGIFGYTNAPESLEEVVVERAANLYDWPIQQEWLEWLPGLVCALNICVRAYAAEQEFVISPCPVYYPFLTAPGLGNRQMMQIFWREDGDNNWVMDWDWLEENIHPDTRLFMLCNPQNPNGRVLTLQELEKLEDFCRRHNLIVCSDEVHCDLILDRNAQHIPYASISDFARDNSITLMSPSKTFNLAGLGCAYAVIPNPELKAKFQRTRSGIVPSADSMIMGYAAAEAAYRQGEPWRQSLLEHLRSNHDLLMERINNIPGLSMRPHQATYLAWIHCDLPGITKPQRFFEENGIGLSPGAQFGGPDYVRLNFGCTRQTLETALQRMEQAVATL
ncbi:MalY/PatB family protein [Parendozoicomonas haliclonae]|uniref:cysteine-S-conjugate beta-lyase n=1 Tax=Parendozoicomonas haliclonae TaxID=1960125 RepID=A0A1X7AJM3_9GAMM|nr:PatB family C-S lyase [Parendozoicomonas haliclonae]SMA41850.1 Cystathionine beta-lyase PatB [Parendozoicomonas haliclonae]